MVDHDPGDDEPTASIPLFAASRLKLERARHFIRELEVEEQNYRGGDPLTVSMEDPDIVLVEVRKVPPWAGAIVGDAVHNLRTALDLMASELARLSGRSDEDVYFPFAADEEQLQKAIQKRFRKAGDDAVELLRKFAPYRGGNHALRALHDLDVQDKHTSIIVAAPRPTFRVQLDWSLVLRGQAERADPPLRPEGCCVLLRGWPFRQAASHRIAERTCGACGRHHRRVRKPR
jgi:hypothetical protein